MIVDDGIGMMNSPNLAAPYTLTLIVTLHDHADTAKNIPSAPSLRMYHETDLKFNAPRESGCTSSLQAGDGTRPPQLSAIGFVTKEGRERPSQGQQVSAHRTGAGIGSAAFKNTLFAIYT